MIILKILGIAGIVLLALTLILLLLPVHLIICGDETAKITVRGRILFFKFGGKGKKPKKDSSVQYAKFLGVERISLKNIRPVLSGIHNLLNRIVWLLNKCRVHRLHAHITAAHEDAAVAAIEYGSISTAVYSIVGLIDEKMKLDSNALDVKVFCDFKRVIPTYSLEVHISFRVLWGLMALLMWMHQYRKKKK